MRCDNADVRLTERGKKIGLVSNNRVRILDKKKRSINKLTETTKNLFFPKKKLIDQGINQKRDGKKRTLYDILSLSGITEDTLINLWPQFFDYDLDVREYVKADSKYNHYIERQKYDVDKMKKNINTKIPRNMDYSKIEGLSSELKLKLNQSSPQHIHEASKIDGMTPSGLMLLISKINTYKKSA